MASSAGTAQSARNRLGFLLTLAGVIYARQAATASQAFASALGGRAGLRRSPRARPSSLSLGAGRHMLIYGATLSPSWGVRTPHKAARVRPSPALLDPSVGEGREPWDPGCVRASGRKCVRESDGMTSLADSQLGRLKGFFAEMRAEREVRAPRRQLGRLARFFERLHALADKRSKEAERAVKLSPQLNFDTPSAVS